LTEYVLRTRKPLLATAQVFARMLEQGEVEPVGTDSVDWLGVPLNIGEKIVGVMVIQTYTDSVRLEQRDLDIMSFVSAQVAIAIERVRAEQANNQRTKELKALYDTSLDIISTHDLPTLLETIVERAARLLNASAGGLYLCDAERREVRCVVSYNTPKDYRGTTLKYGEGAAGTVAETEKPLKIDDYRLWSKRAPVFDQERPFTALISVPIFWQGAVQGVLHVLDNVEDRRFEEANLALLAQFANLAAISIENANLYGEVQRYASELEDRVAERTSQLSGRIAQVEELNHAMADLLQDLQEANRRLEETSRKLQTANVELETFAYSVSHDLKAPLRGIDGYAHLLTEIYAGVLDEEGKTFLQNIRQATAHMSQLIDDLLTYSRLELQELNARPVNARALVGDLLAERQDEIERRQIEVTVEIPFKFITCDAEGLAQAMRNLVDNAIKFTRETPAAQIQIGGRRNSRGTILWVHDNGVGFDLEYHDRIFEIFQRLYTSDAYPGTGIGLSIVRKVMQRMGGKAWAESESGKGATFYLEFPIEKSHRRESNP
jgi:signal transduction histidine kinase